MHTTGTTAFDDMASDIDFATNAPETVTTEASASQRFSTAPNAAVYTSPCKKCNGAGRVRIGYVHVRMEQCFACRGAGTLSFKTSPEQRAKVKATAEARQDRARAAKVEQQAAWAGQHKDVLAWITSQDGRFDFATAMSNALGQYGTLTEGQVAAVRRCIEKGAARAQEQAQEQAQAAASAPTVNVASLEQAFAHAMEKGIKRPKITLGTMKIKPAPATGANAGALYVTEGEQYLGKVLGGKFLRVRDCSDEQAATVAEFLADPKEAAIAYGRRTGVCCVCHRELTDASSIEAGIGPICVTKMGW